jgi:hypothetical protein
MVSLHVPAKLPALCTVATHLFIVTVPVISHLLIINNNGEKTMHNISHSYSNVKNLPIQLYPCILDFPRLNDVGLSCDPVRE